MRRTTFLLTLAILMGLVACGEASKPQKEEYSPETKLTGIAAADKMIRDFEGLGLLDRSQPGWKTNLPEPNMIKFDPDTKYFWLLKTSKGDIKLELWPKIAPYHVSNTIYLTRLGFYNDLSFHRVVRGFMVQGGCPLGNGRGNPNYQFDAEINPDAKHDSRGILSAARTDAPGTDSSQFFITFAPAPHLYGKHTVYGKMIEGDRTLIKIEKQGTASQKPRRPIFLKSAEIIEVPKK